MFETIGDAGIFIDMIVQGNDGEGATTSVSFTVDAGEMEQGVAVAKEIRDKHSMGDVQSCDQIAKVTVSGIGLRSHTHVATKLFDQLAASEINVEMVNTSELQVNAVIQSQNVDTATKRLREAFADSLR